MWDLNSLNKDKTWAPAEKAPNPNHWDTRNSLNTHGLLVFKKYLKLLHFKHHLYEQNSLNFTRKKKDSSYFI